MNWDDNTISYFGANNLYEAEQYIEQEKKLLIKTLNESDDRNSLLQNLIKESYVIKRTPSIRANNQLASNIIHLYKYRKLSSAYYWYIISPILTQFSLSATKKE